MNTEEARTVIDILLTADGGCCDCSKRLIQQFTESFPVYADIALDRYKEVYDIYEEGAGAGRYI